MSISQENVFAALPTTSRGQATPLSADSKGERIAYASNKSIFIRSIDDPAKATQYAQHTAQTTVARISPSGFYCASGDVSGVVRVWDCSAGGSGATKGEYSIISGRINDLAWDGDSQRIIAVGDGKQRYGHAITADSGNTVGEITGHAAQINSVSIRQQRPIRAATGGDDKNLVFFHGAPFKFDSMPGRGTHAKFIQSVAFSPDGNQLVSVGSDKKIILYDGKTGDMKGELSDPAEGHTGSIYGVSWSKDSQSLVTCSGDRTVKLWDVEGGKVTHTWTFSDTVDVADQQVGVVWPAGRSDNLVISLSLGGNLNYLYPNSTNPSKVISGHQKSVTAVISSRAGTNVPSTLWTGSYDGRLCAWDVSRGTAEVVDGDGHTNIVSGLAVASENSSQINSVGWDDSLRLIDASAKTFVGKPIKLASQPRAAACTSDGLVAVCHANGVEIYGEGKKVSEISADSPPTAIAASKTTIAIGYQNSSLKLFSVGASASPKEAAAIEKVGASAVTALAFSPDGSSIAVGLTQGKILAYKITYGLTGLVTGTASLELITDRWTGHTGKVTSIAWNEQATHAISGSLDTNLFLWSVKEPGKRIKTMNAHQEGVNGVVWLADGVYSAGADATVKRWKVIT